MKDWIAKAYKFFWADFLCRAEPFTYEFRRFAAKYPWLWIIGIALILIAYVIWLVYRCATNKWFYLIIFSIMTIFGIWITLHLGGYV